MKVLGYENIYGIEKDLNTFSFWKIIQSKLWKIVGNLPVYLEDAFNFNYEKYDFITMYHPIADYDLMIKLYKKILSEMPVGGIFWESYEFSFVANNKGELFYGNPFYVRKGRISFNSAIIKVDKKEFEVIF